MTNKTKPKSTHSLVNDLLVIISSQNAHPGIVEEQVIHTEPYPPSNIKIRGGNFDP